MNAKKCRHIPAMLIKAALVLLLCAVLGTTAMADEPKVNTLTLHCTYDGTALEGIRFRMYRTATRTEGDVFVPDAPFDTYPVSQNFYTQNQWDKAALTLKSYAQQDHITPLTFGSTDKNGEIVFEELPDGLYLVTGTTVEKDGYRYDIAPFFITLPADDPVDGTEIRDAQTAPKLQRTDVSPQPATVTRKVLKIWDDAGHQKDRPKETTVYLLRDGELYDTVILNAQNNWRYTWDALPDGSDWSVTEKPLPGYTVLIAKEGITYTVTNTVNTPAAPDKPSEEPKLPQTGQLWWPVWTMGALGLLFLFWGLARRKEDAV